MPAHRHSCRRPVTDRHQNRSARGTSGCCLVQRVIGLELYVETNRTLRNARGIPGRVTRVSGVTRLPVIPVARGGRMRESEFAWTGTSIAGCAVLVQPVPQRVFHNEGSVRIASVASAMGLQRRAIYVLAAVSRTSCGRSGMRAASWPARTSRDVKALPGSCWRGLGSCASDVCGRVGRTHQAGSYWPRRQSGPQASAGTR
jgi:hypothetical protein